jgi:hypothetical protein
MRSRKIEKGAALLMSIIVLAVLSAWAISICSISGVNLQLANNQRKADAARACAESGLEVMRFWLSRVRMPSSTLPSRYFTEIIGTLRTDLGANNVSNIVMNHDGSIGSVTLDSASGRTFCGRLLIDSGNTHLLRVDVTGRAGDVSRTIRVFFNIAPYEHPIFDFGLATRGALHFPQNPAVRGAILNSEADIYVESPNSLTAVFAGGNVNLDGDIDIGNPSADVDFQSDVLIAGEQGQTAIDNHVFIGVDPVEFPIADTGRFQVYATGVVIDSLTDTTGHMTLANATIQQGTNPIFGGNVIIEGILLIKSPNIVEFEGNVQLNGLIVGEGDPDNPGTDAITFRRNFGTGLYPQDSQYDDIRSEVGSSILAPGFAASFEGNFSTLSGVVALSGVSFTGNVNANINGTIINYSETPLTVSGNATMVFDRYGSTKVPAGFDFYRVVEYDPSSYSEVTL